MKIAMLTTDNRQPWGQYDNPSPWFGTAPEALLQGFANILDFEVHVVTCTQQPMRSSPERLAENIWFHSLHVPKLGWMRTGYQGCIRAMRRRVQEIRPDIVHGQGTERECSLGAIFSGLPNVITIHGNMRLVARTQGAKPFSFYWLAARLEAFTLPRTRGVICLSHHTEKAVRALARQTWVLPNAVDPSFFEVISRPDEPPLILCVASISPWKNQNAFIGALDGLAASHQFQVVFLGQLGDDAYGCEFRTLIAKRPWCEYAGFADRTALKSWLSRASVLTLPSLEENCPMSVLEAMAAGVPVFAAKVGGVPDLVQDRVSGVLCDATDERSMAQGLEVLLDSPALRRSLSEEARRQANVRFRPVEVAKRHIEIYREVLATAS